MRIIWGVPIILVVCVVTVAFDGRDGRAEPAAQSSGKAAAADECVSKPGGASPQGTHWYYRVERSSGRHCWYLGPAGAKLRAHEARTRAAAEGASARAGQQQGEGARPAPAAPRLAAAEATAAALPLQTNGSAEDELTPQTQDEAAPAPPEQAASSDASPTIVRAADEEQADMPLVWPELSTDERAAAVSSAEAKVRWEYILATIAGALALAAILVGTIFKQSAPREAARVRPRDREDVPANDEPANDVPANLQRAPWRSAAPAVAPSVLPPALRRKATRARADEVARWATQAAARPAPALRAAEPDPDVEESLQRLLRAWQRAAA